jgi:hypothetical protein
LIPKMLKRSGLAVVAAVGTPSTARPAIILIRNSMRTVTPISAWLPPVTPMETGPGPAPVKVARAIENPPRRITRDHPRTIDQRLRLLSRIQSRRPIMTGQVKKTALVKKVKV